MTTKATNEQHTCSICHEEYEQWSDGTYYCEQGHESIWYFEDEKDDGLYETR